MTEPLALVVYERLLPGSQLVNRLQDLKYRVRALTDATQLISCARQEKPMIVLADVVSTSQDICGALALLKKDPDTRHIPVIAIAPEPAEDIQEKARQAGATLVVSDAAVLAQLPQLLDQALQIE